MLAIPHIEMIVAAYAVAAVTIAAMIIAIWLDYRSLTAKIGALASKEELREGRSR